MGYRVAAQDVGDNDEIDFSAIDAPELEMFGTASLKSYWSNMVGQANKKGRVNEFRGQLNLPHAASDVELRLTSD